MPIAHLSWMKYIESSTIAHVSKGTKHENRTITPNHEPQRSINYEYKDSKDPRVVPVLSTLYYDTLQEVNKFCLFRVVLTW